MEDTEDTEVKQELEATESHEPPCFPIYWRCLSHPYGKYVVLFCYFVLFVNGLIFAPQLSSLTSSPMVAPRNMKGAKARHKVHNNFPRLVKSTASVALITCRSCRKENLSITDQSVPLRNLTEDLYAYVVKYNRSKHEMMFNYSSYYMSQDLCDAAEERGEDSRIVQTCRDNAEGSYVDPEKKTSIAVIDHKRNEEISDPVRDDFVEWFDHRMKDLTKRYKQSPGRLKVRYSGQLSLLHDMQEASNQSIESDIFFIPLILLIFGYTVASWRVVILPLVAIVLCILICFTFMYPVAKYMIETSTMAPPLMTSICMAMCIDYSLFLLVRFREEIGDDREVIRHSELLHCMRRTMHWSGEVILVSGGVLALSLLGYAFCSFPMLESFGVGCGIAVLSAISVNMTLIPAIILTFPSFFCYFGWSFRLATVIMDGDDGEEPPDDEEIEKEPILQKEESPTAAPPSLYRATSTPEFGAEEDPFDPWPLSEEEAENKPTKCWYVCGTWTTLFPISVAVIVLTYSLILPFLILATDMRIQYAENGFYPRTFKHVNTFRKTRKTYTSGLMAPLNVRIKQPHFREGATVWNWSYINDTAGIFEQLFRRTNDSHSEITSVNGVSVLGTTFVETESQYRDLENSTLYHEMVDAYVARNDTVSYFSVVPGWYAIGRDCNRRVRRIRNVMQHECHRTHSGTKYSCYIYGRGTEYVDSIRFLFRTFPVILVFTITLTFVVVGIVFKNFFLPIRLFLTIALPMTLIFGLTVLVYQKGVIDYWNSAGLNSRVNGVMWMVPLMSITLLLGLALDYDIFLYSRVDEYMKHGVPLRNAVVRGVCKTGGIITSAGVIMCFAFFGLLLSRVSGVNQFGFMMVIGVLVDTFVIRTMLVPAILSITRHVTWYPPAKEYYEKFEEWWGVDSSDSEDVTEMQQALVSTVQT